MTQNIRNIRGRNARRGVTLLLVLGLMTMFSMLVVTFMVVTTQAMKTSESTAQVALQYPSGVSGVSGSATIPTPNFSRALNALLVGGLDTVIGPHSILENLYGHPDLDSDENLKGTASIAASGGTLDDPDGKPVLLVVEVALDVGNLGEYDAKDLRGSVLTLTKSQKSATIVDVEEYVGDDENFKLHVTSPKIAEFQTALQTDGNSAECIINSQAFGGTGVGYYRDSNYSIDKPLLVLKDGDVNDGVINYDSSNGGFELALRPNPLAPENGGTQPYKKYLEKNVVLTNPDYTAPDYQNMFLAWNNIGNTTGRYYITKVIPSFHRPALLKYWENNLTDAENLRKVVLRPLKQDHPNFTGSNKAANTESLSEEVSFLINGPWDVDNDGDGVQDGIWLDLGGEPVKIDGKLVKQLYSFYVLDMDGRLNVNTHGLLKDDSAPSGGGGNINSDTGGLDDTYGLGAGVAEIRLKEGLDLVSGSFDIDELLKGNGEQIGRYGTDGYAGTLDSDGAVNMEEDILKIMGVWSGAYAMPTDESYDGFGNLLPDFYGRFPLKLDPLGNRKYDATDIGGPYFAQNPYLLNPYGDDISTGTANEDSPFKPIDLEFIIRSVGDRSFRESLLTTPLRYLLGESEELKKASEMSKYRHFVTTRSSDIPTASRAGVNGYRGFAEYFNAKSYNSDELRKLLPPELLRGEKVSLDRIMFLEESFKTGLIDREELLKQKIRFAQEMFYLILVLCPEIMDQTDGDKRKDDIARVAQWCVNLVDFLDVDDIMTPLVFHETDPLSTLYDFTEDFDTFCSGGTYTVPTDYRLVWGMEQPEVALTKTFATHNRRVADSKYGTDSPAGSPTGQGNQIHNHQKTGNTDYAGCGKYFNRIHNECECCNSGEDNSDHICQHPGNKNQGYRHDTTFDQVMIPQGSLFLELYRQGNPSRTYYKNTDDANSLFVNDDENNLDLAKASGGSPVWRLAIGKATRFSPEEEVSETSMKDHLFKAVAANPKEYDFQPGTDSCKVELERFIWFCGKDAAATTLSSGAWENCSYFNLGNENGAAEERLPLGVNEYLVIGPRLFTSFLSLPVDNDSGAPLDGQAAEFGTPDGSDKTFINLKTIATGTDSETPATSRVKIMVAGISDVENPQPLGPSGVSGIGVSVSEPLPSEGYYPVPTGPASSEMITKSLGEGGTFNDKYYKQQGGGQSPVVAQEECHTVLEGMEEFGPGFGTITCYRSIFLQRLADPGRPYHETTNPYITVDWNMIDLHVFNSEEDSNGQKPELDPALDSGNGFNVTNGLFFTVRQWGYTAATRANTDRPNIWDRSFDTTEVGNDNAGLLVGTATGSNKPEFEPEFSSDKVLGRFSSIKIGDEIAPVTSEGDEYTGAPSKAFLHFPWNNGPLSNAYELMLVPACSPGRFGFEFHMLSGSEISVTDKWWQTADSLGMGTIGRMPISNPDSLSGPYFNFFNTGAAGASGAPEPVLARLFDFVRVPSRFNGTIQGIVETTLDPGNLDSDSVNRPVYRMREPGKININTANPITWEALKMDDPDFIEYETFEKLRKTKEGDMNTTSMMDFSAPFRSIMSGNMVPVEDLVLKNATTFMRNVSEDDSGDLLFKLHNAAPEVTGGTTEKGTNQLTALENVIRRGGMFTNRSNVFAVWVTVGYFEVEKFNNHDDLNAKYPELSVSNEDAFRAIYPGGYVLGKEKGLIDGSVTRHRYFYLIDRTIPVGFRRGNSKLNHEDVIIHSRRLE